MRYSDFEKLSLDTAVVGDRVAVFGYSSSSNGFPDYIWIGEITKITSKRRDITVGFSSGKSRVYNRFGNDRSSGSYRMTWEKVELLDTERYSALKEDMAYLRRAISARKKLRLYAEAVELTIDPEELTMIEEFLASIERAETIE